MTEEKKKGVRDLGVKKDVEEPTQDSSTTLEPKEQELLSKLNQLDTLGKAVGMMPSELDLQRLVNFATFSYQDLQTTIVGVAVGVGMDLYEQYAVESGVLSATQTPLVRDFLKQRSSEVAKERGKKLAAEESGEIKSIDIGVPASEFTPTDPSKVN